MLLSNMKVNKKLLPIKGHFLLFNAGTGPLVPYLSVYARQLGFTSATVGLIYTVLPIFGLIAKPTFGIIADRFKIQKPIFLLFEVLTIISFCAILLVPENRSSVSVQLDCGNGITEIKSCYSSAEQVDSCKIGILAKSEKYTTSCDMNCDMSSPKMWQTVCEHWKIPQYCYSNTDNIQYTSVVNKVTLKDNCAYIAAQNVTLNGYTYTPRCHIGSGYVDVNEPCSLACDDNDLSTAIGSEKANMTCVNEMMNYRLCKNDSTQLTPLINQQMRSECKASCDLDEKTPWRLMSICDGWGADVASTCHPKTSAGSHFPKNLSFVGSVRQWTALAMDSCVYMQLNHIRLPDGSTHYPICVTKAQYQVESELFHTKCEISCNNSVVNEIIQAASESSDKSDSQFSTQFWMFFTFMILNWSSQAVVVTFGDAICFNQLGDKPSHYGKQRLWGSVGWGTFSLLSGVLIDQFSEGTYKNYTVAFVLMFIFMVGDIVVSCILKVESTKMSMNIIADVGTLFASLPTFIYMIWTILVGLCTGLLWQFLFWHLEDIASMSCDGSEYVKSLQGMVSGIQTFGGEIPFMFLSGYILKKFGHVNMMSLVLFAFGVRFLLYSLLTNAWWVLPIELLQGITFGMFYPTMTSYANVVSPPGTETTVQGLIGAIFEGVGTSLGSFIGGSLYQTYGGWKTFQWFGIGSLMFCVLHIVIQMLIKDKHPQSGFNQGKKSVDE